MRFRASAIAMLLAGCASSSEHMLPVDLTAVGKIYELQGSCYSINCPDIQYTVSIRATIPAEAINSYDARMLDEAKICGPSGLKLGDTLTFMLARGEHYKIAYPTIPTMPLSTGEPNSKHELHCDFIIVVVRPSRPAA